MPRAGRTCPQCGSSSVVEDDLYSESQLVCQDCGSVVSDGRLVTDTREGTADVRYSQTTAVAKVPCRNQIKGLQRVRALCRILRLSFEMEELAEVYYRKAYTHTRFIRVSLQKKEALVGCCVLASCRLRNWPVALGTISGLLETDPALVGGVYKELEGILDVEIPKTSITDVLEAHSREYKVGSGHVAEELAESSKDLAGRSVALVELAADSWIVTGRHPVPIMMASVFLSWQSLRPTKTRLGFSLNKFCQLSKMPVSKTAVRRVAEMKEVLCKLGQEIPWLGAAGGAAPDCVMRHVEDILQHRHALLRRALLTHEESLQTQEESPGTREESLQTREESLQTREESLQTREESLQTREESLQTREESPGTGVQPSAVDPPPGASDRAPDPTEGPPEPQAGPRAAGADAEDGGANWGKRMLFAPPCLRRAKIRRTDAAERADVNGDEEISDSEIESYIRSPQEVRDYLQTQQQLLAAAAGDGRSAAE